MQGLLATGVGRFDQADVLDRVLLVDAIDEDHSGLARAVGVLDDRLPDLTDGPVLARGLALGVDLLELRPLFAARVHHLVDRVGVRAQLIHEAVGDRDRDVVVVELGQVVLNVDEVVDVRVVDPQHAHVRAAAEGALLDGLGGLGEDLDEGHRALGGATRAGDYVAAGAQTREAKARAAAGLLDQGRGLDRVEDALDRVLHRQHKARAEHAHLTASVHQGGAVG